MCAEALKHPLLLPATSTCCQVVVPLERAGTCLMEVGNAIYGPDPLLDGFRTPLLVRFVT